MASISAWIGVLERRVSHRAWIEVSERSFRWNKSASCLDWSFREEFGIKRSFKEEFGIEFQSLVSGEREIEIK